MIECCFEERNFETLDGKVIPVLTYVSSADTLKKVFTWSWARVDKTAAFSSASATT